MLFRCKYILLMVILAWVNSPTLAQTSDQLTKVSLRAIADEFLHQLDDSTTRILPITKVENRYKVTIENPIAFPPDLLTFATIKVLEDKNPYAHYLIEVEKCDSPLIVYSVAVDMQDSNGNLACKDRGLPKDCYAIYFTEVKTETTIPPVPPSKDSSNYLWLIGIGIMIGMVYWVLKRRKVVTADHLIEIGNFELDPQRLTLTHKSTIASLSGKEAKLLALLADNANNTVDRQTILTHVWQDDGDYVGRTLDVFISKLRKRLSADENIEIINERGVGYRLVVKP